MLIFTCNTSATWSTNQTDVTNHLSSILKNGCQVCISSLLPWQLLISKLVEQLPLELCSYILLHVGMICTANQWTIIISLLVFACVCYIHLRVSKVTWDHARNGSEVVLYYTPLQYLIELRHSGACHLSPNQAMDGRWVCVVIGIAVLLVLVIATTCTGWLQLTLSYILVQFSRYMYNLTVNIHCSFSYVTTTCSM